MTEGEGQRADDLRLFVALPIPASVIRHLTSLSRRGLDAKWQHADDLHITLRFLGPVPPAREPAIISVLESVRRAPFSIEMQNLGKFDTARQFILHACIASTRKLTALVTDITDALTPLGFDFGGRPYVPHITLARLKAARGLDDYIAQHGPTVCGQWTATQFHLMQSSAATDSGRYTPRATFLLR